jgi:hypothetical protein
MLSSTHELVAWYERNANDHNAAQFLGFDKFNANMGCIIADYSLWMKKYDFVVNLVNNLIEWNQTQPSQYSEVLRWHWIDQGLTPSVFKILGASIYIIDDSKYIHPKCSNYVTFNDRNSYVRSGVTSVHHFGLQTLSKSFFSSSDGGRKFLESFFEE